MPATITGQAAAASSAVTTTVTVTLGVAPTAGETLIAIVGHSDDYPSVPAGWTQIGQSVVTGVTRIFTKTASGSEGTGFTFTAPTTGGMSARVMRVTGLGAFHSASANSAEGTNQTLFGSLTTTVADTWLLAAAELHATALPTSDVTWNSSFTAVAADVKSSGGAKQSMLAVAAKTLSATATVTGVTASYVPATTPTNNQGTIVAFLFGSSALTVDVGADQAIYTTAVAALTASAAGGSGTKTYAWTKINGPAGTFSAPAAASTNFTPTGGAGTYTLRCIVSDSSGTAQDDVVVTVTAPPSLVNYDSIISSTGYTATGGTVLAVLSDASDATLVTTSDNPTNVLLDGYLPVMTAPAPGQNFVARIRADRPGSSSGSITGRLYEGATLRSTVTVAVPASLGDVDISFPATDVAAVSAGAWTTITAGTHTTMRVTLSSTAAV